MDEIEQIISLIERDTEIIMGELKELGVEVEDICMDCKHKGYFCELAGLFFGHKTTHCDNKDN